jgi:DNA (cytosine-5)-methyltransferase 1
MLQPIIFSFFSGSGFLDLGFEDSGFHVSFVKSKWSWNSAGVEFRALRVKSKILYQGPFLLTP